MQLARIRSPLTISDRLASSRSSAQQAVAEDNWWIRRHDARKIAWTSAETQRELARVVSSAASSSSSAAISEELPSGFWLPWETKGDAADGAGIVGLTVKIDDIKKVLEQEARPQGAAGVTAGGGSVRRKSLRRPIFAEFGCGSRRLANEMALFQWHTLSVDNGEKGIEPEIPKQWNRPEKDATLKTIKPSEVHPDMFHKSGDAVHYHVCGNIQDIATAVSLPRDLLWRREHCVGKGCPMGCSASTHRVSSVKLDSHLKEQLSNLPLSTTAVWVPPRSTPTWCRLA